jgi:site-specific recombinase XerC
MLFEDAVSRFLTYLEAKGDSQRTVATYDQRLALFIRELDVTELAAVTPEMIDGWVAGMRRRGLAVATVRNRLNDVRSFYRFCVARGYLATSPAAHLRVGGRWSGDDIKAMDKEDFKRMLAVADHPRDKALLLFMASTGCRAGEVAGLRLADVDLVKREAVVNGKTGRRVVDFNQEAAAAIREWLDIHPIHSTSTPSLFVSLRSHAPVTVGTIYQMFSGWQKRPGLTAVSIRTLSGI